MSEGMLPENKAATYIIFNTVSGSFYIGKSLNVRRRIKDHKCDLRAGKHWNKRLQAAWNKYGEDAFGFAVLRYCHSEIELDNHEQQLLDIYLGQPECCNLAPDSKNPSRGAKRSKEHRESISKAQRGKAKSPETRARMREYALNRGYEHQRKINEVVRANPHMLGKRRSEASKTKVSGENNWRSKLTWELIDEMRALYISGEFTQQQLADRFNISSQHVSKILNRKLWVRRP